MVLKQSTVNSTAKQAWSCGTFIIMLPQHNENFGSPNSESSELSKFGRFFRTFVGQSRIQYLQKMIKGHSVCHKIEVDDSLPGPNFHFLVFKYHANYHRPQSYGSVVGSVMLHMRTVLCERLTQAFFWAIFCSQTESLDSEALSFFFETSSFFRQILEFFFVKSLSFFQIPELLLKIILILSKSQTYTSIC